MNRFNVKDKFATNLELEELILKEEPKPIYRVRDDKKMEEIHQLLDINIDCNCSSAHL